MSIGYTCLAVGVPHTDQKSCLLKNAREEKLLNTSNPIFWSRIILCFENL